MIPTSKPHHLAPKRCRHPWCPPTYYSRPTPYHNKSHPGHHPLSGRPLRVGLAPQRRVVVQQRHDLGRSCTAVPKFRNAVISVDDAFSFPPAERHLSYTHHRLPPPCTSATRPISFVRFASPFAPRPDLPLPSCASRKSCFSATPRLSLPQMIT